jgi:hypothetical protein
MFGQSGRFAGRKRVRVASERVTSIFVNCAFLLFSFSLSTAPRGAVLTKKKNLSFPHPLYPV